jgi:benzodiazapine receptor
MPPHRPLDRSRSTGPAALFGFALMTSLPALLGRRATRPALGGWYERLDKPPFQPPPWVFPPVWTALYGLIAVSGWRVYRARPGLPRRRALELWAAQLALNGLWSWLFFDKRLLRTALADCALLFAATGAYVKNARDADPLAAKLFVPYAAWVGFATLLNAEIVRRNAGRQRAGSVPR